LPKGFFPSLYLTKKINKNEEFQINFSRKLKRPGFMEVMPFKFYTDRNNYREGNPTLKPEFNNVVELNYNKLFGSNNFLTSAYFRQIEQPITNYIYRLNGNSDTLVTTSLNGDNSFVYGIDNTLKLQLSKNIEWTLSANLFDTKISALGTTNEGWAINGKSNFNWKIPNIASIQFSTSYESPKIIAQGKTKDNFFSDISIKHDFSIYTSATFTVSDIFDARRFGGDYTTESYTREVIRRRETRYFKLGFMWRFGKIDASIFKMRNRKMPEGGGDMDFGG
jgi:outer membrane receptor protein involved in Fe transport